METQVDWQDKKITGESPVSVDEAVSVAQSLFGIIPDSISLEEAREERLEKELSI